MVLHTGNPNTKVRGLQVRGQPEQHRNLDSAGRGVGEGELINHIN